MIKCFQGEYLNGIYNDMNKLPIGIIDINVDGLYILNTLCNEFKNEDFLYINDLKNDPYEGKEPEVILNYVKKNVEKLLSQNIKLLIVINDSIIEYCSDYLSTLNIPIINIQKVIIDYVNKNFEQKNLILCAKDYILKANLYQKNFNYNHIYNIPSDNLEIIIKENKCKKSEAFKVAEETFKSISKKDCDLLIITSPWLELLKIEIFEFLKVDEMIKLGEIITQEIKKSSIEFYNRGKGKVTILSDVEKNEFANLSKWFNIKYKFENKEK